MPNDSHNNEGGVTTRTVYVKLSDSDKRVLARANKKLEEQMRDLKAGRRQTQLYVEEKIRQRR